jgi:hypothetical protein
VSKSAGNSLPAPPRTDNKDRLLILISRRQIGPVVSARRATTRNEQPPIQPPTIVAVEPVPNVQMPDKATGNPSRLNLLVISVDTSFSKIHWHLPTYATHWGLAKVAAFSTHRA